jgi:SAM-dependent methyltransferase
VKATQYLRRLRRQLIARTLERGGETNEHVPMEEFGIDDPEYHEYEPSGWRVLNQALRGLDVGPEDSFVDLGCGKGRVVVQAARRPFKRVIGVDVAAELTDQAERLLESDRRRRCGSVEIVVADLTTWEVPTDITVAYAYNVLSGASLQKMLDRLADSVERSPRPLHLLYINPEHEDEVSAHPATRLLERRGRARWDAADPRRISIFRIEGR